MVDSSIAPTHKSHLKTVVLGLVIFLLVSAATTVTLVLLSPKKTNTGAQSAKAALSQFSKQEAGVLSKAGYVKSDKPASTYLLYNDSQQYAVYLSVNSGQYIKYQNDKTQTNDAQTTKDITKSVTSMQLKQINSTKLNGIALSLFANDKVVCQISDISKVGGQPTAYILACLDKTAISSRYKEIDALLAKATSDISDTTIKTISMQQIVDGDKQLDVLTTSNKNNTSSTLYFLKNGSDWNYIGLRPTPSVDDKNSFAIPDKLRASIDASPDKAFLDKYIQ